MCLSCEHFEPLGEAGKDSKAARKTTRKSKAVVAPLHHCNALNIDYSDTGVRLDCAAWDLGSEATQKKNWKIFVQAV
jgi:hypothetical protein